ncbi:MAG: hypothetical protein PVI16_10600, partial [Gammaproteobacteria bacterium]
AALDVGENLLDNYRVFDTGNDPDRTAAPASCVDGPERRAMPACRENPPVRATLSCSLSSTGVSVCSVKVF